MLTTLQVWAIIHLLIAFNTPQDAIVRVQAILIPPAPQTQPLAGIPATVDTPAPSLPQFGGTLQVMPQDKSAITAEVVKNGDTYAITIAVLDANGKAVQMAPLDAVLPDNTVRYSQPTRTDTQTTSALADWHADFTYKPATIGQKTLTFTSGGLTKSVVIDTQ